MYLLILAFSHGGLNTPSCMPIFFLHPAYCNYIIIDVLTPMLSAYILGVYLFNSELSIYFTIIAHFLHNSVLCAINIESLF